MKLAPLHKSVATMQQELEELKDTVSENEDMMQKNLQNLTNDLKTATDRIETLEKRGATDMPGQDSLHEQLKEVRDHVPEVAGVGKHSENSEPR